MAAVMDDSSLGSGDGVLEVVGWGGESVRWR